MSKEKKPRFYFRKFLVDPLQLRFVGLAIIHFAIIILIFTSALFVPIVLKLQSGDITQPHVQAAAREFLVLHDKLWLPMLVALLLIVMHNIIFTHRVAGPLFRFRPFLKSVGEGNLANRIMFRKKDHLKKEAEIASEMVESLRVKITNVESQLERASSAWNDLRDALNGVTSNELQQKISAMNARIEECRDSLTVFDTGDKQKPVREIPAEDSVMEPV
jgi:methyl-accepting chemotaxis protein